MFSRNELARPVMGTIFLVCMYICVCMCVYGICVYVCMCVYGICVYVCMCVDIDMYVCVCVLCDVLFC